MVRTNAQSRHRIALVVGILLSLTIAAPAVADASSTPTAGHVVQVTGPRTTTPSTDGVEWTFAPNDGNVRTNGVEWT